MASTTGSHFAHEGRPAASRHLHGHVRRSREGADTAAISGSSRESRRAAQRSGCGPTLGDLEAIAGQSQHGHAFDASRAHYFRIEQQRSHPPRDAACGVSGTQPADLADRCRDGRDLRPRPEREGVPITDHPTFELLTESGEFTSGVQPDAVRAGSSGESTPEASFVAEPVHNLVHRDVLEPSGSTLRATRGGEGREFLASTDSWFRPVSFYIGPDGALCVIDYYRKRIEHPGGPRASSRRTPSEFSLGADRGGFIASCPTGSNRQRRSRPLDKADIGQLVALLENQNLWWRHARHSDFSWTASARTPCRC